MSTEKIEEYQKLYSEYLNLSVELHNYHLNFLAYKGKTTSRACRRTIRKMRELLYHMDKVIYKARMEHMEIWHKEVEKIKTYNPDGTVRRYNYEKRKTPDE